MDLINKIMSDIGFLDILIDKTEWFISDAHHLRLRILREHLIEAHKELKKR